MTTAPAPNPPAARRHRWLQRAALLLALALGLALLAGWLLQPQRAGRLLLALAGNALALDVSAGSIDYRLRGTPQLVLDDVTAQRPGDAVALLRAKRVFIALPWRTLRTRGADLTVRRIELDQPVLDLPALQRWLASRPPSATPRLPTLTDGLHVTSGRIDNDDWRIADVGIDVPALHPDKPLRLAMQGRYLARGMTLPADLSLVLDTPKRLLDRQPAGLRAQGTLVPAGDDWRMPVRVVLTGPLRLGRDSVLLQPATLGLAGRYRSGPAATAFRLGLHGPLAFNNATWRMVPATVVLAGDANVPTAHARGSLSIGSTLNLRLHGALADWPAGWPALPAPLSASTAPLPFMLDYRGAIALTDTASLTLRRNATALAARFRLPEVLAWLDAGSQGSPLPPLAGTLSTPRVTLDGVTLDGVELDLDDAP
ncbi:hypothetical protein [Thermomonas sp.]|uniref:hypothetical protein n=1 Tax=Thermomonas sp. TaxID=1971895 RepID=UPI003918EA7F